MNRIVHLALKVEDLEKTTEFYQKVFGFREVETRKTRDHLSRHLTDGALDFTLIKYDEGTESAESKASGEGPCIHHFAIEVDNIETYWKTARRLRLQDDQRSGRHPGEVPRARRHRRRARAERPLQAARRRLIAPCPMQRLTHER